MFQRFLNLFRAEPDKNDSKVTPEPEPIGERTPDVEVLFEFNGVRKTPVRSGYRPAHDFGSGRVIGGIHQYFDIDEVAPDGTARGTIKFFTPEDLTASIQCGTVLPIQDGARIVGHATVVKVLNPVLERK